MKYGFMKTSNCSSGECRSSDIKVGEFCKKICNGLDYYEDINVAQYGAEIDNLNKSICAHQVKVAEINK